MYRLFIVPQAKKEIRSLKQRYSRAVIQAIEDLRENPRIGKPLARELLGKYSYRIGMYRVIYVINQKDRRITIISAGHRSTVYKEHR